MRKKTPKKYKKGKKSHGVITLIIKKSLFKKEDKRKKGKV